MGGPNTPASLVRTNDGAGLSGSTLSNTLLTPAVAHCTHFSFGNSYIHFPMAGGKQ